MANYKLIFPSGSGVPEPPFQIAIYQQGSDSPYYYAEVPYINNQFETADTLVNPYKIQIRPSGPDYYITDIGSSSPYQLTLTRTAPTPASNNKKPWLKIVNGFKNGDRNLPEWLNVSYTLVKENGTELNITQDLNIHNYGPEPGEISYYRMCNDNQIEDFDSTDTYDCVEIKNFKINTGGAYTYTFTFTDLAIPYSGMSNTNVYEFDFTPTYAMQTYSFNLLNPEVVPSESTLAISARFTVAATQEERKEYISFYEGHSSHSIEAAGLIFDKIYMYDQGKLYVSKVEVVGIETNGNITDINLRATAQTESANYTLSVNIIPVTGFTIPNYYSFEIYETDGSFMDFNKYSDNPMSVFPDFGVEALKTTQYSGNFIISNYVFTKDEDARTCNLDIFFDSPTSVKRTEVEVNFPNWDIEEGKSFPVFDMNFYGKNLQGNVEIVTLNSNGDPDPRNFTFNDTSLNFDKVEIVKTPALADYNVTWEVTNYNYAQKKVTLNITGTLKKKKLNTQLVWYDEESDTEADVPFSGKERSVRVLYDLIDRATGQRKVHIAELNNTNGFTESIYILKDLEVNRILCEEKSVYSKVSDSVAVGTLALNCKIVMKENDVEDEDEVVYLSSLKIATSDSKVYYESAGGAAGGEKFATPSFVLDAVEGLLNAAPDVDDLAVYTAGENITISDENQISAVIPKYTGGENVTVSDSGVISAVDTTYTAGENVTIINNRINATIPSYTAGDGIKIVGRQISIEPNTFQTIRKEVNNPTNYTFTPDEQHTIYILKNAITSLSVTSTQEEVMCGILFTTTSDTTKTIDIQLPSYVKKPDNYGFEHGKTYELNIYNNLLVMEVWS